MLTVLLAISTKKTKFNGLLSALIWLVSEGFLVPNFIERI